MEKGNRIATTELTRLLPPSPAPHSAHYPNPTRKTSSSSQHHINSSIHPQPSCLYRLSVYQSSWTQWAQRTPPRSTAGSSESPDLVFQFSPLGLLLLQIQHQYCSEKEGGLRATNPQFLLELLSLLFHSRPKLFAQHGRARSWPSATRQCWTRWNLEPLRI